VTSLAAYFGDDPVLGGYRVLVEWTLASPGGYGEEDVIRPTGRIVIEPAPGALVDPPDAALFKRLGIGGVFGAMRHAFAAPEFVHVLPKAWLEVIARERFEPRSGRKRRSPYSYALWAQRYVDACERDPHSPLRMLVDESPGETPESVRQYLTRARKLGLLTSPPPGRAGGKLTEFARRLLADGADTDTEG
jgi:hypothetical protein